jgi:hypothetical protein
MPVLKAEIINSDFVKALPEDEITFENRRYLLIPVAGCSEDYERAYEECEGIRLSPRTLSDFGEDNGWADGAQQIVEHLDLGESIKQFDGIGQAQVIVRVV